MPNDNTELDNIIGILLDDMEQGLIRLSNFHDLILFQNILDKLKEICSEQFQQIIQRIFLKVAETGQANKVKMLLDAGANLKAKTTYDGKEQTPIQIAAYNKHWAVVHTIAENGQVSEGDPEAFGSALLRGSSHQQGDTIKVLLKHQNIALDRHFLTGFYEYYYAFHLLVLYNQVDLMKKMFKLPNFNINIQSDNSTPTALTLAAQDPRVSVATLQALLEHAKEKPELNKRQNGKTVLEFAADTGQTDKAILLIQHANKHDQKLININNALNLARLKGHNETKNAIQIQHWMQENTDISTEDLTGLWILTRSQLDYVLRQKKTLANSGCKLHPNVDVKGLTFEALPLPYQAFSVLQYTTIVLGNVDQSVLAQLSDDQQTRPGLSHFVTSEAVREPGQRRVFRKTVKPPQLARYYVSDPKKNIGQLSNEEFIAFTQWLRKLYSFFMLCYIPCPSQLQA